MAHKPLVVGIERRPLTLDPHHHNDAVTWSLLSNFYDGLVRFSTEMKIEPALAESWEQLDATHWRFHLRRDVHFQSGDGLRAADVVASFERARKDPRSAIRHHLLGITRMVAPDELTVLVETDGPRPTLLNRLVFLWVVPAADAKFTEISEPNGTGPYRVVRHDNPDWLLASAWSTWHGMPEVRQVRFVFDADNRRLFERFLAGEIDVLRQLPEDQLVELRNWPHLRAEPQPRLAVQLLVVSQNGGFDREAARALADVRVHRAILLGCNRQRWVSDAFRGNAVVASQYVHPAVFGYDPGVAPAPYSPQEARELLAQAGYPRGFDVTLDHAPLSAPLISAIAADLAKIGIRVTSREAPWEEVLNRANAGKSALVFFAWSCSTGDASDFLVSCVHSSSQSLGFGGMNFSHFHDLHVDALIEAADRELDSSRRLGQLQDAQRRTIEALPILPLTVRWAFIGVSDRVEVASRHDQWLWVAAYRWREPR